jgi:adenylate cyclase
MVDPGPSCTADAIRAELARVLASPSFDASERNRRFLSYLVEETLAGRAGRIKAYSIATLVFHRDTDFDAQSDPIVRVEAQRLRRALEHYYLTAGRAAAVRITIPKGSYVPAFEVDPSAAATTATPPRLRHLGPGLAVLPFEVDGEDGAAAALARGLVRHLRVALARFGELDVFALAHGRDQDDRDHDDRDRDGPALRLGGGVSPTASGLAVDVWLIDAASGRHLWAEAFEGAAAPATGETIAAAVARTLAQPYGVLFALRAQQLDATPAERWDADDAVVQAHAYRARFAAERARPVHAALERWSVHREAVACRALLLAEDHRLVGPERPRSRSEALAFARRAIELAPHAARSHHALAAALWADGDVAGGLAALQAGLALNPNDTTLLADLGFHHALRAEWDAARERLDAAFAANPALPQRYRLGFALADYAHGRFEAAWRETASIDAPAFAYAPLLRAVAAVRLGDGVTAAAAVSTLLRADPGYGRRVARTLADDHVEAALAAAMLGDLRRAGLAAITAGAPACRLVRGPAA